MHPQALQLRKLPIAERLQLVEDLWDDLASTNEPFPLSTWHRTEADRRAAELEENPAMALTREELWQRVEQARG